MADSALNLDEVIQTPTDELSDEQKTFLNDNQDNLTDEQKETYKDILETEEEEEEKEPEVRTPLPEKKEEPPADEEEEVDPQDKKVIGKLVEERVKPLEQKLQEQADANETDSFIANNPEYKPYRAKILSYMKHPAYKNIPAHNIARIVAGPDLLKLGAKKEREAQQKVNETKGGGSSGREPGQGAIDWHTASKEDFLAKKAEVLGRQG